MRRDMHHGTVRTGHLTRALAIAAGLVAVSPALGQVNGAFDPGEYGAPLATQTVQSQFNQSINKLDAIYAKVLADGSVRILITGNMNNGSEGYVSLLDNGRGGGLASVDPVTGAGTAKDWRGAKTYRLGAQFNSSGALIPDSGSVFAPGFNPRLALSNNTSGGSYYNNAIELFKPSGDGGADYYLGSGTPRTSTSTGPATPVTQNYNYYNTAEMNATVVSALDNTNTINFADGSPTANTTGFEYELNPAFLRLAPGTSMKIFVYLIGGDGAFMSNQTLPGLPSGTGNLGNGDSNGRRFNWNNFPSTTYVTVAPPTSATGGTWFSDSNWSYGASPTGINSQAAFTNTSSGTSSVGINGNPVVGTLYISGNSGVSFSDSNSGGADLTIQTFFGDNGVISVSGTGDHSINVPLKLNSPADIRIPSGSSLTLSRVQATNASGNVGINVSGGGAVVISTSYVAGNITIANDSNGYKGTVTINSSIEAFVRTSDADALRRAAKAYLDTSGASGLGMQGLPAGQAMAIFTNDVDGTNGYYVTYDGVAVTNGDVVLRRAYKGDTNLDGVVDGSDIKNIVEGQVFGYTGWNWGDSNYDGVVDDTDVQAALANEYLPALFGSPGSVGAPAVQGIPEPSSVALTVPACALLMRRRRAR